MSEFADWDADQLVRAGERELRAGMWKEAVELFRRALVVDEDHARAHASMALALLMAERHGGAEAEAKRSLQCDGGSAYGHYAMAKTAFAQGRIDDAWTACHVALGGGRDLDEEALIAVHVLGGQLRHARGETEAARVLFDRAYSLSASRITTLVEFARFELATGDLVAASRYAEAALRRSGTDVEANVIAGEIALANGNLDSAHRHAQFALLQETTDKPALRLWAAIKTRRQPATGWAWRALVWVATRTDHQQTRLLVISYLGSLLLAIVANALGLPGVQSKLIWGWMGFLVALYWGPVGLHKLVAAETGAPDRTA